MTIIDGILIQLTYVAINLYFAFHQARLFDRFNEKINHKGWAAIYGAIATVVLITVFWWGWKGCWLWLSAIAMHFPVFSIALNKFRKLPRAWDYHNTTDLQGSKWDLLIDKHYDEVLFGSIAAWLFLQFLIFW